MRYDVAIVGAGPAGIFCAYELRKLDKSIRIALIEKGMPLEKREGDLLHGFGGAGAHSDGKYNITGRYGGWLPDYIGYDRTLELARYVRDVYIKEFRAKGRVYNDEVNPEVIELQRKCAANNIKLVYDEVVHFGTDGNYEFLTKMQTHLAKSVDMFFGAEVESVIYDDFRGDDPYRWLVRLKGAENGRYIQAKAVVLAPGRSGSRWLAQVAKNLGLTVLNNQVDIGVRVEIPYITWAHMTDMLYEPKLYYITPTFQDQVRDFCVNPRGHVVAEKLDEGIYIPNGHAYADESKKSDNTNFALLVSKRFTKPFNDPQAYGRFIASLGNMLGHGVLVQRLGDLRHGRRSTEERIMRNFVVPTLREATPGDLSLVLPHRYLVDIIETLEALDKIAPGTASDHTLLYGVEVKFYSTRLELDHRLQTKLPDLYAIGDGAGITRGLSQAAASGVWVARQILGK